MLDLTADPIALTAALVDIPSESRHEQLIADEIETALKAQAPHFEVIRNGDAVLARTNLGWVKAGWQTNIEIDPQTQAIVDTVERVLAARQPT